MVLASTRFENEGKKGEAVGQAWGNHTETVKLCSLEKSQKI